MSDNLQTQDSQMSAIKSAHKSSSSLFRPAPDPDPRLDPDPDPPQKEDWGEGSFDPG